MVFLFINLEQNYQNLKKHFSIMSSLELNIPFANAVDHIKASYVVTITFNVIIILVNMVIAFFAVKHIP